MASLYEMAQGPDFDPVESFFAGRNARYQDKFNQNNLAELARMDQARPLMGQALGGDKNAFKSLMSLDAKSAMDVGRYQTEQAKAAQDSENAKLQEVAGALYNADTPEKWGAAITYLERKGYDIDDFDRDFSNRDAFLGAMQGIEGVAENDLKQFNAQTSRMNAEKAANGQGPGFTLMPGQTRFDSSGRPVAAAPPKPVQPRALTSVDKNAILEADDQVQMGKNAIDMLTQALSLNDKAGSGYLAGAQAFAARNDPTGFFDDEKGAATTDFNNIVMGQALSSMKAIFGGNPTEGERAVLLQLQGAADKTPVERKAILERGIALAKRRAAFNTERAAQLRSGDYFGGASTVEPSQSYPGADGVTDADIGGGFEPQGGASGWNEQDLPQIIQDAQDAIQQGADPEAVIENMIANGVNADYARTLLNGQ